MSNSVRVTFKPTNTTIEYLSIADAARVMGMPETTFKRWLNGWLQVPPYLALEVISRPRNILDKSKGGNV